MLTVQSGLLVINGEEMALSYVLLDVLLLPIMAKYLN